MQPLKAKNTAKTLLSDSEATLTTGLLGTLGYVAVESPSPTVQAAACIGLAVAGGAYSLSRPFKHVASELGGWKRAIRYRRERNRSRNQIRQILKLEERSHEA